jgi:hypothetical protein
MLLKPIAVCSWGSKDCENTAPDSADVCGDKFVERRAVLICDSDQIASAAIAEQ